MRILHGVYRWPFLAGAACLAALAALPGLAASGSRRGATGAAAAAANSRRFEFTSVLRVPAAPGGRLRLWVPLPHSDAFQTISRLRISSPVPWAMRRFGEGNREAYFVFPPGALEKPAEIRVRFDVLRRERRASLADPRPGAPPALSLARYLRPESMIPLNGVIGEISRSQTAGIADPLARARRLYDYVIAHMRYDKSGSGWGRGDAVWACSSHRGNCTDFHSLFIGLARAAGIPARFKIGFAIPEDRQAGEVPGYHCWAEFYLQGAGWVPVDASEAWLDPRRHDYYFGSLDSSRVLFTMGRDLRLSPPQAGPPINFFVYPYAELDGRPFAGVQHQFSFRDLPGPSL